MTRVGLVEAFLLRGQKKLGQFMLPSRLNYAYDRPFSVGTPATDYWTTAAFVSLLILILRATFWFVF